MQTVGLSPTHGEPDTVKVVRPVRREGRRNLPLKSGKALLPYSTIRVVKKLARRMGHRAAADWIDGHAALYVVGIFRGFEAEDEGGES